MTHTNPRISATLIVRDESAHLDDCLASIQPHVDEIVVVDTGSIDDTRSIAVRAGARVFDQPWDGDFAAARNRALDEATGDWILYIDADERLVASDPIAASLPAAAVAALVRFTVASGFTPYWEMRLFRRSPDIRFEGGIHETMVPDVRRLVAAGRGTVVETTTGIVHLGYDGPLDHKHRRNLPLLEAAVHRDPGRSYLWHELARARGGLGDDTGALDALRTAVDVATRHASSAGPAPIDALVFMTYLDRLLVMDLPVDAELERARGSYPDNHHLAFIAARHALAQERWDEALELATELSRHDPSTIIDGCVAFDERIFGIHAWAICGVAAFRLGHHSEAAEWFSRCEAADPSSPEFKGRRAVAEHLATGSG